MTDIGQQPLLPSDANLTVIIITLNEEANLKRCLASLPFGAQIIVVDSGSRDGTQEVAEAAGAKFVYRAFDDFASQKNFALSLAKTKWVLSLDADEVLHPNLAIKIIEIASGKFGGLAAYRIPRRLVFMGRLLRFGKTRDAPVRFFKREDIQFVGKIHESVSIGKDKLGSLSGGWISHFSYSDMSDYFLRFNRYTTEIANAHHEDGQSFSFIGHILRPWFEFIARYFLRGGFLDGYPGYVYALCSSLYAFIKYVKLSERRMKE